MYVKRSRSANAKLCSSNGGMSYRGQLACGAGRSSSRFLRKPGNKCHSGTKDVEDGCNYTRRRVPLALSGTMQPFVAVSQSAAQQFGRSSCWAARTRRAAGSLRAQGSVPQVLVPGCRRLFQPEAEMRQKMDGPVRLAHAFGFKLLPDRLQDLGAGRIRIELHGVAGLVAPRVFTSWDGQRAPQ